MASPRAYLIRLVLLGAAYSSVAYLSLFLLIPAAGTGASLVWPTSAIGLVALTIFGYDLWPALLVPLFFVLLFSRGLTPPIAAGIALGNTLESLMGAYLLKRYDFDAMLSRLQDAMLFTGAAIAASLVSATITTVILEIFGHTHFNEPLWVALWVGHAVSLVSFGPMVMRWSFKPYFTRSLWQWFEGIVVIGSFAVLSFLIYWTPFSSVGGVSLLYISIVPLIWAALRTGPRGITLCLAIMGSLAATGAIFGFGPLAQSSDHMQVLFSVQLVVGILSLIFLLFTSIVEERKEATKALQSHVGQLEIALDKIRSEDQAKSDFIAILAHELRNPLSPLLSGIELLKAGGQGPDDVLQMMGAHLHTVARLLDDLLDISRITQKKFKLQREPVTLNTVITQSIEMVSPYLRERDHTLTTILPEEELWIDGDPVRLAQIVVNLLNNAAKYTEPGGRIRLEVTRDANQGVVTVTDSGRGIDSSRLKKIFEPFGVNDSGRAGGLHIGLSLAKRMAELHHGTLVASSAGSGRGSTFTVRLPLMPTLPLPVTPLQPTRSRFSKEKVREVSKDTGSLQILVVDDNEAAADSLSRLLTHNGHRTSVAYDAPQALSICENTTPQVALLDIGLPTMDGYELARRLRVRFGDKLVLVALTGYGQSEDKQKARDAGFDDHLTKPVSVVDVERVLAGLVRR